MAQLPQPPVTSPGGAGMYQGYLRPYYLDTPAGLYLDPPATAVVAPGNPIGGAFTLPTGFVTYNGWLTGSSGGVLGWPGYITTAHVSYLNGPGKFGPNHGATGPTRIVFPTTMGNPYPTYDTDLRRFGLRLAEHGGKSAKKRAAVAVARKLSVLLHRLWVTGEVYEPIGYGERHEQAA